MGFLQRIKEEFVHAFAVPKDDLSFSDQDLEIVEKIAGKIVQRGLGGPAMITLGGFKPFTYIGSQVMVFLAPFAKMVLKSMAEYDRVEKLMERREAVDFLIERIEYLEAERKRNLKRDRVSKNESR